jgi:nicotinate-nucleotide--dimethylbenzimidazole phosphoribosyltransferase
MGLFNEDKSGMLMTSWSLGAEFQVPPVSRALDGEIQAKLDNKTKPVGALGRLESLAAQMARVQQSLSPSSERAMHLVFAADHGVCAQQVSPFPQAVTVQMVLNFLQGGAAINVFCRHNHVGLKVINAGVMTPLPEHPDLIAWPVRAGSRDFTQQAALTEDEMWLCLSRGAQMVDQYAAQAHVLSVGEMGIGNTTTAAALMAALLQQPAAQLVGAGTGASAAMQQHKAAVVQAALDQYALDPAEPLRILQTLGGLEIAMMTGALLRAAALQKLVLIDGFIATSAWLVAYHLQPNLLDYSVFAHQSHEQGHQQVLQTLGVTPLLNLDMRLGEGTGAVAAVPLVRLATAFMNEMASFADAGVSQAE